MLHEYNLSKNSAQAYSNVVKKWGEEATSQHTINRWVAKFCSGETSHQDEKRRGSHSSLYNNVLKETVEANLQLAVRELAEQFSVSISTIS